MRNHTRLKQLKDPWTSPGMLDLETDTAMALEHQQQMDVTLGYPLLGQVWTTIRTGEQDRQSALVRNVLGLVTSF